MREIFVKGRWQCHPLQCQVRRLSAADPWTSSRRDRGGQEPSPQGCSSGVKSAPLACSGFLAPVLCRMFFQIVSTEALYSFRLKLKMCSPAAPTQKTEDVWWLQLISSGPTAFLALILMSSLLIWCVVKDRLEQKGCVLENVWRAKDQIGWRIISVHLPTSGTFLLLGIGSPIARDGF